MVPKNVFNRNRLTMYGLVIYNRCSMENVEDLKAIKPISVEVLPVNVEVPSIAAEKQKYIIEAQRHKEIVQAGIEKARQDAIDRIAKWAEKKKIFNGTKPPEDKQLNRIYKKLKQGLPIVKAIKGVCSVPTWNKWKEEFPEVAALEEHANAVAIDRMMDKKEQLAANQGTHMGEIARDKIQIDELDKRIDRIDRLTENRNKKSSAFGGGLMPIQINVGYGK